MGEEISKRKVDRIVKEGERSRDGVNATGGGTDEE